MALLFAAVFAASYAIAHQAHQRHAQAVLVQSERAAMAKIAAQSHGASCQVAGVQPGQLSGILSIPALGLTAPVEEGTDDQELDVAIGHDPQSVWPGVSGAAVFLAHDVSYFVHLNVLKPGDAITYRTACNTVKFAVSGQQVVAAGSPVSNTTGPSLVLDTCWPPNALFFTPDRLLVRATEIGGRDQGGPLGRRRPVHQDRQGHRLHVVGPPVTAGAGADPPAERGADGHDAAGECVGLVRPVTGATLVGGGRARDLLRRPARRRPAETTWWSAIAPGVAMPPQLDGAAVTGHDAPLDVEIDSGGGSPTQVVLRTTVTLAGGSAPGEHAMTIVLPVHGTEVTIASWAFD